MPLDPDPVPLGNIVKLEGTDPETGAALVEVLGIAGGGLFEERPLYVSHFVTCPNADQHRKKARR